MEGYNVFWRPGTDNAGIATQSVVERMLEARKGLTKEELGREQFLEKANRWREENGSATIQKILHSGNDMPPKAPTRKSTFH